MVGRMSNSTIVDPNRNLSTNNIPHVPFTNTSTSSGTTDGEIPTLIALARRQEIQTRNMDLLKETIDNILEFFVRLTIYLSGASPRNPKLTASELTPQLMIFLNRQFHRLREVSVPETHLFDRKLV